MATTIFADACIEWKRWQEQLMKRFEEITEDELDMVEVNGEICAESEMHIHSMLLACEYMNKIAQRDIRRVERVSQKHGVDALLDETPTETAPMHLLKNATMVLGDGDNHLADGSKNGNGE